jgi:hypothetical protein
MSNRLQDIFRVQKQFSAKYFKEQKNIDLDNMSDEDKIKWSKEFILCSSKELYEMLDEIKWKQHRFISKDNNIDNFLEEGVDAFKFLMNLFLIHGCTEEQFYQKFLDKSKVVDIRYEQEKQLKELKNKKDVKIAVIDIDGIICNHSASFLENSGHSTIYDYKNKNIAAYHQSKYIYRASGEKRKALLMPDACGFLQTLKDKGYLILLLTARPYEKMIRIYADTLYWLETNKIQYDFLFFNKNKEQFIIDNLSADQVKFCIDDEIENVNKLTLYFTTYLLPNYTLYDRREIFKVKQDVRIIDSLSEIKL